MQFTVEDKHLIKWLWLSKIVDRNAYSIFLTKDEVYWDKDTDSKSQCDVFNFGDLCSCVGSL